MRKINKILNKCGKNNLLVWVLFLIVSWGNLYSLSSLRQICRIKSCNGESQHRPWVNLGDHWSQINQINCILSEAKVILRRSTCIVPCPNCLRNKPLCVVCQHILIFGQLSIIYFEYFALLRFFRRSFNSELLLIKLPIKYIMTIVLRLTLLNWVFSRVQRVHIRQVCSNGNPFRLK